MALVASAVVLVALLLLVEGMARLAFAYKGQMNVFLNTVGAIDLEKWSKTSLVPRDQYFLDSAHLYEEGQARIGKYLAQVLSNRVRSIRPATPPGETIGATTR